MKILVSFFVFSKLTRQEEPIDLLQQGAAWSGGSSGSQHQQALSYRRLVHRRAYRGL
jgi:hypothetical protein